MATRKNEASWIESRERWQINVQSDGERRTFSSSIAGKKGKIAAEKKADAWLEKKLVNNSTKAFRILDDWGEALKNGTSWSHYRQLDQARHRSQEDRKRHETRFAGNH